MKTDANIKLQIKKAIDASATLDASGIDISVQNGRVTLSGYVDKFCKKETAKKLSKDVEGVISVTEAIVVMLSDEDKTSDADLTETIAQRFAKNFGDAQKDIKAIVKDGYVWIEGQVKWKYQKDLAEECIACIDGIKWIENNIIIPESIMPSLNEKDIFAAIYGDQSITRDIKIEILGNRVILKGAVENANQKNLVTRLVRTVPGVKEIENFLLVEN